MLSEVIDRQRRTVDFMISSGVAKSSRLKLPIRGLQVQVLPGVLQKHWETSAFRI
jgi:hypothetical protein